MGYQVTTVHPGEHAAERGGGVAVDDDFAGGLVHALNVEGAALLQIGFGVVEAGLRCSQIQIGGFYFLRELFANRLFNFGHFDGRASWQRRRRRPCS